MVITLECECQLSSHIHSKRNSPSLAVPINSSSIARICSCADIFRANLNAQYYLFSFKKTKKINTNFLERSTHETHEVSNAPRNSHGGATVCLFTIIKENIPLYSETGSFIEANSPKNKPPVDQST